MVTRSWTWPEFYSYICDYEYSSSHHQPPVEFSLMSMFPGNYSDSISNLEDQINSSRTFNIHGLGIAYRNHFVRTLSDIPVVLGTSSFIEGRAKFIPVQHRAWYRRVAYRQMPMAMGIGGAFRQFQIAKMYLTDLSEGQFPGTDESIFV